MCHCILAHKSNNGMFHCVRLSVLISEIIHVFFYILLIPKYLLSAPQADLLSMSNKVWLQYMLCTFYKVIYQFKAKKISKRSMMCFGFHFTLIYSSFFLQNIFYAFFFFLLRSKISSITGTERDMPEYEYLSSNFYSFKEA